VRSVWDRAGESQSAMRWPVCRKTVQTASLMTARSYASSMP
jgi:hypothetical protein